MTTELVDEASVEYMGKGVGLSAEALSRALDPMEFVERRTLYGGPAPEECRRRMAEYEARLREDEASVAAEGGEAGGGGEESWRRRLMGYWGEEGAAFWSMGVAPRTFRS